jgi:hypothetical protein
MWGNARLLPGSGRGRHQAAGSSQVVVYCANKGMTVLRLALGPLPAPTRATFGSRMPRGPTQMTPGRPLQMLA